MTIPIRTLVSLLWRAEFFATISNWMTKGNRGKAIRALDALPLVKLAPQGFPVNDKRNDPEVLKKYLEEEMETENKEPIVVKLRRALGIKGRS